MKKSNLLILICIVSIISIFIKEAKASNINDNELMQITEVANQQNIEIDKWSMYIKEPITKYDNLLDIKNRIEEIKAKEKGYTWTKLHFNEDHYKITGERKNSHTQTNEKILLIYFPKNDKFNLSVTYDVKGSSWNKQRWSEVSNLYKSKIEKFSVFYTVEGVTSIDKPLLTEATGLLQMFSGESIQSLNEEGFVSLSAFTQRWKTKLPVGNGKYMNLHIAYRNTNDSSSNKTRVTIGTPIITSEY